MSTSITEVRRSSNDVDAGACTPPDRAGEQRVAGEALDAVHDEGEHPVGMPGRVQAADAKVTRLDDVAVR